MLPVPELQAPGYVVHVTATRTDVTPPARHTASLTVAVLRPPLHRPNATADPPLVVSPAGPGAVRLATTAAHWHAAAAAPLQYRFMARAPEGLLLPLPQAPGFGPHPVVTVPLPWLPRPAPGPSPYTFVLYVRAARGPAAGPFPASAGTSPPEPGCTACSAGEGLFGAVACGLCVAGADAYRPEPDLLRHLRYRPQAPGLLDEVALIVQRFAPGAGGAWEEGPELCAQLLAAAVPRMHDRAVPALLLRTADALLASRPAAHSMAFLAALQPPLLRAHDPSLDALDLTSPRLHVAVRRGCPGHAPPALHVPSCNVSVVLPPEEWAAVAGSEAVDVVVSVAQALGGRLAAVEVRFHRPLGAQEVLRPHLSAPLAVRFGGAAHAQPQPVTTEYECVAGEPPREVRSEPEALASGLICLLHTLGPVVLRPAVRIAAVSGCGLGLPPSTLHCAPDLPALTVRGGDFGPAGADVALAPAGGGPPQPCPVTRHIAGAVPQALVCERPALTPSPAPLWYDVMVVTQHGPAAVLRRALVTRGQLVLTALHPLGPPAAACVPAGPRALVRCPRAGAAFGVTGQFLLSHLPGAPTVSAGPFPCPAVAAVNATYLECRGLVGDGQGLALTVRQGGVTMQARATISFAGSCDHRPGAWVGARCDHCAPGYGGRNCTLVCPGAPALCGGHGICSEGVRGTGTCACARGSAAGYWAGPACDDCLPGYYGPRCDRACPVRAYGVPGTGRICSGHGACSGGRRGMGLCTCHAPYSGPVCGLRCEGAGGGGVCSGHGECEAGAVPGEGECRCARSAAAGHWAGAACARCARGWTGPGCAAPCPTALGRPCGGHGACAWGGNRSVCVCTPTHTGPGCGVPCQSGPNGLPCSGHGACLWAGGAEAVGVCHCNALWDGPTCDRCAWGRAGPDCDLSCLADQRGYACSGHGVCLRSGHCDCHGGFCGAACAVSPGRCAATRCPPARYGPGCAAECRCGPHGACDAGPFGTGQCRCGAGWAGAECRHQCPGTNATHVCGGHGVCVASARTCHCDPGWRSLPGSVACATACPGPPHSPCHGHGTCTGAALCVCDPGYNGQSCAGCPRDTAGRECGGHGHCSAHGTCVCAAAPAFGFWSGPACDVCAARYWGPGCAAGCVTGVTRGQVCVCHATWATPNCSVQCPFGGPGLVCSGHGVCDWGRNGTGLCVCLPGYTGRACDVLCRGGRLRPCGGHGVCLADGACRCQATAAGHWAGEACEACAPHYFGPNCDLRCPRGPSGVECGGHGRCVADRTCECYADAVRGFWTGAECAACTVWYYGAQCQGLCQGTGSGCHVCGGHGVCDAGINGTGTCSCHSHWAGVGCGDCAPGHWAPDCTAECPGSAHSPCSGHGTCSAGVNGTGSCTCNAGPGAGWWAGAACDKCRPGYYGPRCDALCPRNGEGRMCAGHGRCIDGRQGTGQCACHPGYVGFACALQCPVGDGAVCSGRGVCTAPGPRCNCSLVAGGRWVGSACERCAPGWVGPHCTLPCPTDAHGRVCAGAGDCVARAPGAECVCRAGYVGRVCDVECPGGVLLPCGGHGTCNATTGTCRCAASDSAGHWTGPQCGACRTGWSGPDCRAVCPAGAGGVPCSGRPCIAGACVCEQGVCGRGCGVVGAACALLLCPVGHYGAACARRCPRTPAGLCAGHGTCLAAVYGTGLCRCAVGYAGPVCEIACPVRAGVACSGHGLCDAGAAGCVCAVGYARPDCSVPCPVGAGQVCAGHGTCRWGARGDGTCLCVPGYGAPDCGTPCPGLDPVTHVGLPCGGHGHCTARAAACRCSGHWGGPACGGCAPGWFGGGCSERCWNGQTSGQVLCLPLNAHAAPSDMGGPPGATSWGWRAPAMSRLQRTVILMPPPSFSQALPAQDGVPSAMLQPGLEPRAVDKQPCCCIANGTATL